MAYPPLLSDMRWSAEWPNLTVRSHRACACLIWWRGPNLQVRGRIKKTIKKKRFLKGDEPWIERGCAPAKTPERPSLPFLLHETGLHPRQSRARRCGGRRDQNL